MMLMFHLPEGGGQRGDKAIVNAVLHIDALRTVTHLAAVDHLVSLTGSVGAGVATMQAAAKNVTKVSLELGGKA
jgi:acyl-CoA reductase-like NAD-dependent aldehyde dehydrogenase